MVTSEAETDSLTMAFFLLKYDFDVLEAKSEAKESIFEARIADLKADHRRTLWTMAATFAAAMVAVFIAARLE